MAQRDSAQQQADTEEPRLPDMDEADARNGEPAALDDEHARRPATTNRTGEKQAEENRENELPA